MQDPRLPRELERRIFLLAVRQSFNEVGILILVSKRVHEWIIPEAFRVVIITVERKFPVVFNLERFKRYGRHIRSLLLTEAALAIDTSKTIEYISLCPNITHLTMWGPRGAIRTILSLPSPQLLQVFAHLTHLLISQLPDPSHLSPMAMSSFRTMFPNLTHLGVPFHQDVAILRNAVQTWNTLQVVLMWFPANGEVVTELPLSSTIPMIHSSFVMMHMSEGKAWNNREGGGGPDIWVFAESVIKSRK